jgi:hypothetical protein
MTKWWLVTTGAVTDTNRGPVILIMAEPIRMLRKRKLHPFISSIGMESSWHQWQIQMSWQKTTSPNPWWFQHTYEHSTWIAVHWYATIQGWWVGRTQQSSSHFPYPRQWLGP